MRLPLPMRFWAWVLRRLYQLAVGRRATLSRSERVTADAQEIVNSTMGWRR